VQKIPGAGLVEHVAIGLGGDGEPVRDADTIAGQLLEHLTQRGVLPADQRHVLDAQILKETNVSERAHHVSSRRVLTGRAASVPIRVAVVGGRGHLIAMLDRRRGTILLDG
jgi:hypothetical protein